MGPLANCQITQLRSFLTTISRVANEKTSPKRLSVTLTLIFDMKPKKRYDNTIRYIENQPEQQSASSRSVLVNSIIQK